jgi:hypothetical protein
VAVNLLFQKKDIYLFVEEQQQRIRQAYETLPDDQAFDNAVIEELKKRFRLAVPVLKRDKIEYEDHLLKTSVESRNRGVVMPHGQVSGESMEYVFHVPFDGDPKAFDILPSAFDGKVVMGKVIGSELLLRFVVQSPGVDVQGLLNRELTTIETRLFHLRGSKEHLEQQLNITLATCQMARRRVIEGRAKLSAVKLDMPRRVDETVPAAVRHPVSQRSPEDPKIPVTDDGERWDVFISHASEDKAYVETLAAGFRDAGISVWLDSLVLHWGSSLREAIDNGLKRSRFVIVVLSKAFLARKKWTEYELSSAFAIETVNEKRILPIWHGIAHGDLREYSPGLTDRLARESDKHSFEEIANELLILLGRSPTVEAVQHSPTVAHAVKEPSVARSQKGEVAAYAWYEGTSGQRVQLCVHKSANEGDRFVFEDTRGEIMDGMLTDIATKYALADRILRLGGFGRTTVFNGPYPELRL